MIKLIIFKHIVNGRERPEIMRSDDFERIRRSGISGAEAGKALAKAMHKIVNPPKQINKGEST